MSRCFPFPPPGYERKAGADNVDLLKQEKHKEKKHKKEKRDKEKREGKEKKEKDRGDEKHRDKKEKKDKRREKKEKDKGKEKEKDRSGTSYEKKQPVQTGYTNEDKVLDQKGAPTFPALQSAEKSIKNSVAIKRPSVTLGGQNGERVISTNHVAGVSDAKCVQELAKRLKTDHCSGSEEVSGAPDHRKNDDKDQLLGKAAIAGLDGKERTKDRRHNNEQKLDVSVNKEQPRLNGTVKVHSLGEAPGQRKLQEIPKPSEVNAKKIEWREIITGREGGDMQGDKLKDKYIDKSHGKVKESRKKEERAKEKSEQKHIDQEKLKAGNKNGVLGSPHSNSLQAVKEHNRTVAAEGNLKKRKESETNGFLHGDEVRANKLQKQAQLPVDNGIEPFQISTKRTPPRPEPTNNVKVNKEETKINGAKGGAHASPPPLHHPPSSAAVAEAGLLVLGGGEASSSSVKPPPHPDSKFLSEILKVPKLDELPDLDDDQEWLFSSSSKNKSNGGGGRWCVKPEEEEEVWGECIHIESADIYALPYVFPY